jgi:glycosyltransferase involved in cell wall biosynthesis
VTKKRIDFVVPCFNEEESLEKLFSSFTRVADVLKNYDCSLIIIDNGSSDRTLELSRDMVRRDSRIKCIELSRNFGKEASLSAGLLASRGDAVIPMDADLQDPIDFVIDMIEAWEMGDADIILAKRRTRKGDGHGREILSSFYFRIFRLFSDVDLPSGVGEFRLMDRRVVESFAQLSESQRFVRGLFAWLGFKTKTLEFDRPARQEGKSRFTYLRLLNLAIDGITSFSVVPLRLATLIGILGSISTFLYGLVLLILALFHKISVPGYASLLITVLLLGSIQLLTIGIVGEYVGKTLLESKRRPAFIVREVYCRDGN